MTKNSRQISIQLKYKLTTQINTNKKKVGAQLERRSSVEKRAKDFIFEMFSNL